MKKISARLGRRDTDSNASVNYTETTGGMAGVIGGLDVLSLNNNKPFEDQATRDAIVAHAGAGKGLLLVHAALWYSWKDWPEYNRTFVGGGSRGHDKYGEFEVTVTDPKHPVMAGVPATFTITDELYYHVTDPEGAAMEVLATGRSPVTGKVFPVVWITNNPKARIVCITLGHDGKAHEHPAYQSLLKNSLKWVAGRP